jgi:signal transduction histidine kinase
VSDGVNEYVMLRRDLIDLEGRPVANLCIFRSFESARQRIADLRRNVIGVWLLAVCVGLALTWSLARRIIEPVKKLDRAASEVARQNYGYRVLVGSNDELGRLASTFNSMCESLQAARRELIRQERISTIGRLAGSIVHDLRNPLAAIYGSAEMLIDADLSPQQVKRLAASLYKGSRRIQELLQDLVNVTRGKTAPAEICRLREVAGAAVESLQSAAEAQSVKIETEIPEEIELPLERARVERVFFNLISNALEAMPGGGAIRIAGRPAEDGVVVEVADTGPGISPRIREQLFQPFVTHGKKGGLGLGLALARQTILDHGGDLWVESEPGRGARFWIRLPLVRPSETVGVSPAAAASP